MSCSQDCKPGKCSDCSKRYAEIQKAVVREVLKILESTQSIEFRNEAHIWVISNTSTEKVVLFDGMFVYYRHPTPLHVSDLDDPSSVTRPFLIPGIQSGANGMGILPGSTVETYDVRGMADTIVKRIIRNLG